MSDRHARSRRHLLSDHWRGRHICLICPCPKHLRSWRRHHSTIWIRKKNSWWDDCHGQCFSEDVSLIITYITSFVISHFNLKVEHSSFQGHWRLQTSWRWRKKWIPCLSTHVKLDATSTCQWYCSNHPRRQPSSTFTRLHAWIKKRPLQQAVLHLPRKKILATILLRWIHRNCRKKNYFFLQNFLIFLFIFSTY